MGTEPLPLKNGSLEAAPLVQVTMAALAALLEEKPVHFFELVSVARDASHRPWGKTGADLIALSLLSPDYTMHDSIRNIVLSAVTGNGLEMALGSPVAVEP